MCTSMKLREKGYSYPSTDQWRVYLGRKHLHKANLFERIPFSLNGLESFSNTFVLVVVILQFIVLLGIRFTTTMSNHSSFSVSSTRKADADGN